MNLVVFLCPFCILIIASFAAGTRALWDILGPRLYLLPVLVLCMFLVSSGVAGFALALVLVIEDGHMAQSTVVSAIHKQAPTATAMVLYKCVG